MVFRGKNARIHAFLLPIKLFFLQTQKLPWCTTCSGSLSLVNDPTSTIPSRKEVELDSGLERADIGRFYRSSMDHGGAPKKKKATEALLR